MSWFEPPFRGSADRHGGSGGGWFPNGDPDFNAGDAFYLSSNPIPEPSSLGLLALAGALMFFKQRNVAR
jgi:hypothetical protein